MLQAKFVKSNSVVIVRIAVEKQICVEPFDRVPQVLSELLTLLKGLKCLDLQIVLRAYIQNLCGHHVIIQYKYLPVQGGSVSMSCYSAYHNTQSDGDLCDL